MTIFENCETLESSKVENGNEATEIKYMSKGNTMTFTNGEFAIGGVVSITTDLKLRFQKAVWYFFNGEGEEDDMELTSLSQALYIMNELEGDTKILPCATCPRWTRLEYGTYYDATQIKPAIDSTPAIEAVRLALLKTQMVEMDYQA